LASITFGSFPTLNSTSFAFSNITSISFLETVSLIPDRYFCNWSSLSTVTFPSEQPMVSIGDYSFSGTNLSSLRLPRSLFKIGDFAFFRCSQLSAISFDSDSFLSSIGAYSFAQTSIASIVIPDRVRSIGGHCFESCSQLASVAFGSSLQTIGASAFSGCSALANISSSSTNISWNPRALFFPPPLAEIGARAFMGTALSYADVSFHLSLSLVERDAFSGLSSIQMIYIEGPCTFMLQNLRSLRFIWSDAAVDCDWFPVTPPPKPSPAPNIGMIIGIASGAIVLVQIIIIVIVKAKRGAGNNEIAHEVRSDRSDPSTIYLPLNV
jgi:hypothetical protein